MYILSGVAGEFFSILIISFEKSLLSNSRGITNFLLDLLILLDKLFDEKKFGGILKINIMVCLGLGR